MSKPVITQSGRSRRAVTLVELLVAGAVLVVVLGIALGMWTQSEKSAQRLIARESALQFTQTQMRRIQLILDQAYLPQTSSSLAPPVLTGDRFEAWRTNDAGRPQRVSISLSEDRTRIIVGLGEDGPTTGTNLGLGRAVQAPEGVTLGLEFAYAGRIRPGEPPEYRDAWNEMEPPALVRVALTADLPDSREPSIRLQTATIPGLLPPAVRPVPTPEPTMPNPDGEDVP